ncbi:phage tail sheath subtilisin-like domain-containing protein [Bacillus sp. JJ1503]|uniref:phage tail sheath subtilisin-like domain-containing protein n=1 Tax=Bacillus sp. JJ1503 TaxID=3122956 RepID=UPI002FFEDC97
MSITQWDPTALPIRPGLYINFKDAAIAQITGGARGTVAIPLKTYAGQAQAKTFYTIEKEGDALILFGQANIQSIKFALQGGAKEVLVYTMPATPIAADYVEMREAFEARPFNVFVYDGEFTADEQDSTVAWRKRNETEKKHFYFVTGGSAADDQDPTVGNARSTKFADDATVNLIVGTSNNGKEYSSGQYAAYIAGLIAGTPINRSITYAQVPVGDVTKRLRNSEIVTALQAGSLVLVHDGEKVKVEQGIATSKSKIRKIRAKQAVATDVEKTARDHYIGKLDNNEDGQMALINAIKAYLETLEVNSVLTDIVVMLDPQRESKGDQVFLFLSFTEIDSMEKIFLTIETQ